MATFIFLCAHLCIARLDTFEAEVFWREEAFRTLGVPVAVTGKLIFKDLECSCRAVYSKGSPSYFLVSQLRRYSY